jgi:hypothetical protein
MIRTIKDLLLKIQRKVLKNKKVKFLKGNLNKLIQVFNDNKWRFQTSAFEDLWKERISKTKVTRASIITMLFAFVYSIIAYFLIMIVYDFIHYIIK